MEKTTIILMVPAALILVILWNGQVFDGGRDKEADELSGAKLQYRRRLHDFPNSLIELEKPMEHGPSSGKHLEFLKAWFRYGRFREWSGAGTRGINDEIKLQMTMNGQAKWDGGYLTAQGKSSGEITINPGQLASNRVHELLKFSPETGSPIWNDEVWLEHRNRLDDGLSLSPPHYDHSSEDLRTAWTAFEKYYAHESDLKGGNWAVWSSISPWVEASLFDWGVRTVTVVDYNVPLSVLHPAGFPGATLRTLSQAALVDAYAKHITETKNREAGMFDAIVAFSGIEHDGLGRYGDPIHPDGDMAAMREMYLSLREGGLLFLAVPVAAKDDVVRSQHRVYGPLRLPKLVEGFEFLGRVWASVVVEDGTIENTGPESSLYTTPGNLGNPRLPIKTEHHQPVIVLRRPVLSGTKWLRRGHERQKRPLNRPENDEVRLTK